MYKKQMKYICILMILLMATSAFSEEYRRDITRPPVDEDEAFALQVWVSIQDAQTARVAVEIFDQDSIHVRDLLKGVLPRGYHKYYWDKRDDNGAYVKAGDYYCKLTFNGHREVIRPLEIKYSKGEQAISYEIDSLYNLTLNVLTDSAVVSIWLYSATGNNLEEIVADTLLNQGKHSFGWDENWPYRYGQFIYRVKVYDYINEVYFKRKPPGMK